MNDDNDINITPFGITAIITGLLVFGWIDGTLEPWVIETMCRELLKCGQ